MAEITPSEAVTVLKGAFGERLGVSRERGLREMREVLMEHFGLSRTEADELLAALEATHSVRWVEVGERAVDMPQTRPQAAETMGEPTSARAVPLEEGYWQLGGGG